ncbi:hypothetical protein ACTMTJ_44885 [Phytohabitans sp. LJ34]|uniref:hypothetical protein n=1 Tax=Phytohabitans sp. LJ34 TaxID=3452217 RepID=UPI003F8CC536
MSVAKQVAWIGFGLVTGAVAGVIWGWLGSDGYESWDSAIGTGFLCALAGALVAVAVLAGRGWVAHRRHRR